MSNFWKPNDELYHHGILGQKWGKRNGPPYPLGASDHSSSEKKAGWRKSLNSVSKNGNNKSTKKETGIASNYNSKEELIKGVLKNNPNAAVANPSVRNWIKSHKKEIAIGVGAAAAIGIGAYFIIKGKGAKTLNVQVKNISTSDQAIKKAIDIIDGNASDIFTVPESDFNGFLSNDEKFVSHWLVADKHRLDSLTEADYLKMDNLPIKLEKGQNMYRVMNRVHEGLRDTEYVSFSDEDRARYLGFLPKMWGVNRGLTRKNCFEAVLKTNLEIKAPGKKETFDIMESALKKYAQTHYKATITDSEVHEDLLKHFNQYFLQLGDRNYDFREYFFNELKSKGYNACVDYNDANRLSDFPLIILNASKNASVDHINKWSSNDTAKIMESISLPKSITNISKQDFDNIMANINDLNDIARLNWYMNSQKFT